jgi:small-conductance mechanosensitive channel
MDWHRFHASASIALLRTLLICINIIFLISGGILFLLGVVLRSQLSTFLDITPEMSSSSPFILIGLGLIIFFIGLFAFWCTLRGHVKLLYIYSTVVFLIFVAEILLAVTVLMKQQTYEETFKTSLNKVMQLYPDEPMASHVDRLQNALSCCGIDTYEDWFQTPYGSQLRQVPASCCKKTLNHTCVRTNLLKEYLQADINTDGCYSTVISAIKSNYPVFGGIIIAIALFPLIGAILACCLARQMSKQRYEQVD